jgi:hypothetical protein
MHCCCSLLRLWTLRLWTNCALGAVADTFGRCYLCACMYLQVVVSLSMPGAVTSPARAWLSCSMASALHRSVQHRKCIVGTSMPGATVGTGWLDMAVAGLHLLLCVVHCFPLSVLTTLLWAAGVAGLSVCSAQAHFVGGLCCVRGDLQMRLGIRSRAVLLGMSFWRWCWVLQSCMWPQLQRTHMSCSRGGNTAGCGLIAVCT